MYLSPVVCLSARQSCTNIAKKKMIYKKNYTLHQIQPLKSLIEEELQYQELNY